MNAVLARAYEVIFDLKPVPRMSDWMMALMILNKFDVPKLGEELAKQCIFQIVNHIEYPNNGITQTVVGQAEGLATELWDGLPDEPHMNQIAHLENVYSPRN